MQHPQGPPTYLPQSSFISHDNNDALKANMHSKYKLGHANPEAVYCSYHKRFISHSPQKHQQRFLDSVQDSITRETLVVKERLYLLVFWLSVSEELICPFLAEEKCFHYSTGTLFNRCRSI